MLICSITALIQNIENQQYNSGIIDNLFIDKKANSVWRKKNVRLIH